MASDLKIVRIMYRNGHADEWNEYTDVLAVEPSETYVTVVFQDGSVHMTPWTYILRLTIAPQAVLSVAE